MDARSRAAYEAFGDVVTFDTTYRKNKYGLLFTPFSGVNHHYQTIQFGCTFFARWTIGVFPLIVQYLARSYWGKHLISMITHQDVAIGADIKSYFLTHVIVYVLDIQRKSVERSCPYLFQNFQIQRCIRKRVLKICGVIWLLSLVWISMNSLEIYIKFVNHRYRCTVEKRFMQGWTQRTVVKVLMHFFNDFD